MGIISININTSIININNTRSIININMVMDVFKYVFLFVYIYYQNILYY